VQIRKVYQNLNPELLYDGIKDFGVKYGLIVHDSKITTSAVPGDSSSFIYRGSVSFVLEDKPSKPIECLIVNLLGSDKGETKVIMDFNEELLTREKLDAFQSDLEFMFGSYETHEG